MDNLQSKLEQIESAIARGVLKVRHGDEMVEYRCLSEMIRIGAQSNNLAWVNF